MHDRVNFQRVIRAAQDLAFDCTKACRIEAWRNRELVGELPYVYLDGVILKRSCAGEVKNISVLIAIGVGTDGFRQILGVAEGDKEDLEGWRSFLCHPPRSGSLLAARPPSHRPASDQSHRRAPALERSSRTRRATRTRRIKRLMPKSR